jgi:hypothetical protein
MADCFCGCGRRVKWFQLRRRGLNAAGRDALACLARLDYAEEVARERGRGDLAARTEAFASLREDGQRHSAALKEALHGDGQPVHLGEFKTWLTNAGGFAGIALLDPQLQAKLSAGASDHELRKARDDLG